MLFGTALVAYLSAAIAASLTVHHLTNTVQEFDDLAGKPVAALTGHQTVAWLKRRGIQVIEQPDVDGAVEVLLARQVDAVVHDAPALAWWSVHHPSTPVLAVGRGFDYKDYAIAIRPESHLRIPINVALGSLREAGFFDELDRRWMGGARR
jgi:polar amino acid transport system substrate-binding protein